MGVAGFVGRDGEERAIGACAVTCILIRRGVGLLEDLMLKGRGATSRCARVSCITVFSNEIERECISGLEWWCWGRSSYEEDAGGGKREIWSR